MINGIFQRRESHFSQAEETLHFRGSVRRGRPGCHKAGPHPVPWSPTQTTGILPTMEKSQNRRSSSTKVCESRLRGICRQGRTLNIFESGPTGLTGQNYYDKLMEQIRRNELEKRVNVHGTREEFEVSELEQVGSVFRE